MAPFDRQTNFNIFYFLMIVTLGVLLFPLLYPLFFTFRPLNKSILFAQGLLAGLHVIMCSFKTLPSDMRKSAKFIKNKT